MTDQPLSGVCVVVTNPNGAVVASASNFDPHKPGGFRLKEIQTIHARNAAMMAFAKNHLNEWLAGKSDAFFAEQLWRIAENAGYRMQEIEVGGHD